MAVLAERSPSEPRTLDISPIDIFEVERSYEIVDGQKRFKRDECELLERVGILTGRYELIDGIIIEKVGQNLPHSIAVSRIVYFLMGVWGQDRVFSQTSMEVAPKDQPSNRPEPDVFVLDRPAFEFQDTPGGDETLLAVEVADSTLRDNLVTKASLYARANVPELWVLDVKGRKLYAMRYPSEGEYHESLVLTEDDIVSSLSAPTSVIKVAELLPPMKLTL